MLRIALCLFVSLSSSISSAQLLYVWKDAAGTLVYSEAPPAGGQGDAREVVRLDQRNVIYFCDQPRGDYGEPVYGPPCELRVMTEGGRVANPATRSAHIQSEGQTPPSSYRPSVPRDTPSHVQIPHDGSRQARGIAGMINAAASIGAMRAAREKERLERNSRLLSTTYVDAGSAGADCQFQFFTEGDEKGRQLAVNAMEECVQNKMIGRGNSNEPIRQNAYRIWHDHFQLESTARNEAVKRSQEVARAENTRVLEAQRAFAPSPSLRCKPDGFGGMRCN